MIFFVPEHFIFKAHYDKPIFTVPRQTKSRTYSDSNEEGVVLREAGSRSTSKVSGIVKEFPSRGKQKMDAAKKTTKYDDNYSKNEEYVQQTAMLKLQSEAQMTISQSQKLRANMEFLKLAVDCNLPHLDKIKNVAVKSFFDQIDKTVPGFNKGEVVVIATPSPTNNHGTHNIANGQGLIPLNQAEL